MSQSDIQIEPFFLESPRGSLFCMYLSPTNKAPEASVLYLHPFAEEMHKSRRMAALQARALASAGYAVLQIDLTGCGDSAGDFADASWSAWRDDARHAHAWLHAKSGQDIILWGLRSGALLAADIAGELHPRSLLLWQPVTDGSVFLNQFLRIKLASEMLSDGQAQSGTKDLLAQLESGQGVEVGGNMLSPAMARELGALKLGAMPPACQVHWLEVSMVAGAQLSPAAQRVADAWRAQGVSVFARPVTGEPFWATQEITECLPLIEATLEALRV